MKIKSFLFFAFVIFIVFAFIYFSYQTKQKQNYYSYTRAICSEEGWCVDALVECEGSKVVNVKIITKPIIMDGYVESKLGWCSEN